MTTGQAEQPVLLERAEELAAIDAVIADGLAGFGRFVVVEGSAGIGKSSILSEARLRAGDAEMTVLGARGTEIERSFSYGVVRQLFERLVAQSDEAARSRLLEGAAAHASRLFSAEQLPGQLRASEDDAFALVHGLYWLALNLAEERPLLISIDDLQWADEASLRWVAYLVRRLEGTAVGVLCAVRPTEDEDPVVAELLADPATTIVRPSALSAAAVTDLVRNELSADADETFCVACHRATGGNPLLLEELIRTLAAEGVTPSAGSVEVLERLAPDAVARSVKLRLARLPAEAAALARAVAVLGDGADGRHAAALAGIERRALAPTAAVLSRVDLLLPDPPLRFVHPLVRNAVYEASQPHERALQHAKAAGVLAAAGAPVEQVAGQVLHAPPESVEEALAPLRSAAREATARGLPAARPDTCGGRWRSPPAMPGAPSCWSNWPRPSRVWALPPWSRGYERPRVSLRIQRDARWQSSISDGRSIGRGRRRRGCKCSSRRSSSGRSKTTWAGGCKPICWRTRPGCPLTTRTRGGWRIRSR